MADVSNTLEVNYDSGSDESDGEDVQKPGSRDSNVLLDTWLKELDNLTTDMDPRPVDPFRFSQATLEDTQEDELNAILGELSALQMSLDREIKQPNCLEVQNSKNGTSSSSNGGQTDNGVRTDSPDNDSGFSDNASLLSSGSSLSAAGSSSGSSTASCALNNKSNSHATNVLHASEDEKAEKIRVALEKMRQASVTRLYVKAFTLDGSSKALMVDESMTCGRVLALLSDKNHVPLSSKWALVEHIPHLHMERVYEDHENMVENLLMWTRDSKNKIFFVEREDKYDMFLNPQRYFLGENMAQEGDCMDEHTKNSLVEEFFNHGLGVPEVESVLYLKAEGKKAWKKFPFVLRASGIYYYPKGKSHANSSKDLVCLAPIDHNQQQAYQGIGWKKKFKAPTEFGFVIKPARLQVKSHRHMKYLCAEDGETLRLWMTGMRIAKYGKQLWENYRTLMEDLAHEDLDRFGRSVSLACMPQQNANQPVIVHQEHQTRANPGMLQQSNRMSGEHVIQEKGSDTVDHVLPPPPVLTREEGFESDSPVGGTIKRKPSAGLVPKIPLTLNTRSIVNVCSGAGPEAVSPSSTMTIQRKRSLSGNSSASSNSSSSHSQIYVTTANSAGSTVPNGTLVRNHSVMGKPPTGSLLRSNSKPEPVAEESPADAIDYDSLPPPPPELLSGPAESHSPSPKLSRVPPAPPAKPVNTAEILTNSPSQSQPKKGVSFASELTERLKTRNDPIYGTTTTSPNPNPSPKKVSFTSDLPLPSSSPTFPKKLEEPPQSFLSEIQRVMQKKWQVAQKCNADRNTTPHEILGFKFAPENHTDESHVQAWVSQHYGNTMELNHSHQHQNKPSSPKPPPPQRSSTSSLTYAVPGPRQQPQLQTQTQPIYAAVPAQPQMYSPQVPVSVSVHVGVPPPMPMAPQIPDVQQNNNSNANNVIIYENFQGRKSSQVSIHNQYDAAHLRNKKPPPPVPKRAESTHLSAHIVFN